LEQSGIGLAEFRFGSYGRLDVLPDFFFDPDYGVMDFTDGAAVRCQDK